MDITGSVWAHGGTGVVLGLAGGLAPGPLTALVLSQTLRFGTREGIKTAFAPVLTDGPMLAAAALALSSMSGADPMLGGVALVGAAFLTWLAWDTATSAPPRVEVGDDEDAGSVKKAVLTNALNPHPYLFWFTVGGPIAVEAFGVGWRPLAGFLVGFFSCLIGSKIALALLAGRLRQALLGRGYRWVMRGLGAAMLAFGWMFAMEGGSRLGWW